MIDLLRRIRERKLVQWVLAYVAGAWITLEALDTVAGVWGWPPMVSRGVFVALGVGLFATVVLAWYHGERGRQRVSGPEVLLLTGIVTAGAIVIAAVVRGGWVEGTAAPGVPAAELFPDELLVHWLGIWIFGALQDWGDYAFHLGRMMEADGEDASVVARFEEGIQDPAHRADILREIADGRTGEAGVERQTGIGSLNSPQNRFLAARLVYDDEAALEILDQAIRGEGRGWAYRPGLAALMGPELLSDPEARAILDELNRGILRLPGR